MKFRQNLKIIVDILMTAALFFLMGYQFWGSAAHEYIGIAMFVLFILHHMLNASWHKNLFKGKYSPQRIFMLCVDVSVLAAMLLQMISGVIISMHIFTFLHINNGVSLSRELHILGAYWGFALMSVHIGMHRNMIVSKIKRNMKTVPDNNSKFIAAAPKAADVLIAAYGIYAFVKRDFLSYMLLQNKFVFMDYSEPKLLFYLDYIAIAWLFIFIGAHLYRVKRII